MAKHNYQSCVAVIMLLQFTLLTQVLVLTLMQWLLFAAYTLLLLGLILHCQLSTYLAPRMPWLTLCLTIIFLFFLHNPQASKHPPPIPPAIIRLLTMPQLDWTSQGWKDTFSTIFMPPSLKHTTLILSSSPQIHRFLFPHEINRIPYL